VPVLKVSLEVDLRVFKVVRVSRAYRDPRVVRAFKVFPAHLLEKAIQVQLDHRATRESKEELVPKVRGDWKDPEDITADLLDLQDTRATRVFRDGRAIRETRVSRAFRASRASRAFRVSRVHKAFRDLLDPQDTRVTKDGRAIRVGKVLLVHRLRSKEQRQP
jgi:hypothetical protein